LKNPENGIKRILVATDFSDCSNNALVVALAMAQRHAANITLVHSIEALNYKSGVDRDERYLRLRNTLMERSSDQLSKYKDTINKQLPSIEVNTKTLFGPASDAVSTFASENEIELVK
jgi:nucleotide-binding universal stress UspA family protein